MTARKPGAMTRQQAAKLAQAAKAAKAPSLMERFWSKVDRRGPDECWPWLAAVRRQDEGYGAFWLDGRHQPSNRVAMMLSGYAVPQGMEACHTCDNPRCCNPAHLFAGTRRANNDDKVAKDRQARGETHYRAKLTDAQVEEIRALRPAGRRLPAGLPQKLADQYGVSRPYISALFTSPRRTN